MHMLVYNKHFIIQYDGMNIKVRVRYGFFLARKFPYLHKAKLSLI